MGLDYSAFKDTEFPGPNIRPQHTYKSSINGLELNLYDSTPATSSYQSFSTKGPKGDYK